MSRFKKTVIQELKRGQELSTGDKLIANRVIDDFTKQWEESTSEELIPSIPTLEMVTPRLHEYGFKLPLVESWMKDDENWARQSLVERGKSGFPERR